MTTIGPMILYGKDKSRMIHFLNEVLDFEWNQETDLVSNSHYQFRFINQDQGLISTFELFFWLDSKAELDELISKFNFYIYRVQDRKILEKINYFDEENYFGVALVDLDGRSWKYCVNKKGLNFHENH